MNTKHWSGARLRRLGARYVPAQAATVTQLVALLEPPADLNASEVRLREQLTENARLLLPLVTRHKAELLQRLALAPRDASHGALVAILEVMSAPGRR